MSKARITCMPTRVATSTASKLVGPTVSSGGPRGTAHQRGYGHKWRVARLEYLRECPLCVFCEARGDIVVATVVDHKIPHRGNMTLFWDRKNWQGLCVTCHSSTKQKMEN